MSRPSASERLANPHALLTRTDLTELGLQRGAVDAVFRALPVVVLPGYSRPMIKVGDYRALIERSTFRGDRVRPTRGSEPLTQVRRAWAAEGPRDALAPGGGTCAASRGSGRPPGNPASSMPLKPLQERQQRLARWR